MRYRHASVILPALCLVLVSAMPVAWSEPDKQYTLLSLDTDNAFAIDKVDDTVVGIHEDAEGRERAAILFPVFRDLGWLEGGVFAVANAVAGGRVCGASGTGPFSSYEHAFVWDAVTGLRDLGTTGDVSLTSVCAAVNATLAVGYGDDPTGAHIVPLMWENGGAARILPTGTGSGGYATVTNDAGDVCGQRRTDSPDSPHFLSICWWKEARETPVNIHTLEGDFSIPLALNNTRQVCGAAGTPGGVQGFVYDPTNGMRLVTVLPGDTQSLCNDLNDLGDAVGTSRLPDPSRPAFLHEVAVIWGADGQPIDLNTRVRNLGGRVLGEALGVSNRGTIIVRVGRGEEEELVLLIPDTALAVVPPEEATPQKPHRHEWRQRDAQHWASGNRRLSDIADLIDDAQHAHDEHGHGHGR